MTDRRRLMDRPKTLYPPIFDYGGIKTGAKIVHPYEKLSYYQNMTVWQFLVKEYKSLTVFVYLASNCIHILFILSMGEVRRQCAFVHLRLQMLAFPTSFGRRGLVTLCKCDASRWMSFQHDKAMSVIWFLGLQPYVSLSAFFRAKLYPVWLWSISVYF